MPVQLKEADVAKAELMLTKPQARKLVDKVRQTLEIVTGDIATAYHGQAHVALGYGTGTEGWKKLVEAEWRQTGWQLPASIIPELSATGMSTRAVAAVAGVHQSTVVRTKLNNRSVDAFASTERSVKQVTPPERPVKVRTTTGSNYPASRLSTPPSRSQRAAVLQDATRIMKQQTLEPASLMRAIDWVVPLGTSFSFEKWSKPERTAAVKKLKEIQTAISKLITEIEKAS